MTRRSWGCLRRVEDAQATLAALMNSLQYRIQPKLR